MQNKYQAGQRVYIIQSNRWVRKATVLKYASGMYTIKFTEGGGLRLRESRLFSSEEEAQEVINRNSRR